MADETLEEMKARLDAMRNSAYSNNPQQNSNQPPVVSEIPSVSASQPDDQSEQNARLKEINDKAASYSNLMDLGDQNVQNQKGFFTNTAPKIVENIPGMYVGEKIGSLYRKLTPVEKYDPNLANSYEVGIPKAEKELGSLHDSLMNDLEQQNALRNEHLDKGYQLKIDADLKQFQLEQLEKELSEARDLHHGSLALEPEHFMPNQTTQPTTNTELTQKPLGGSGTAAYAEKFGATPEEALHVPSMSVMQKENIPTQAGALERVKALEPNVMLTEESPLLLTPEGQLVVRERKEQQNALKEEQKKIHKEAVHKVATARFEAENRVKELERQREKYEKEHKDAIKEYNEHMKKTPIEAQATPEQKKALDEKVNLIDELKSKTAKQYGNRIARIGSKILPRFIPYYGSAMAIPQGLAAKEEYNKHNYGRALTYGIGAAGAALQATANPFAMGIGDIMQAPAAGLGIYDLFKDQPSE